jgi:tRNA(Ile)-lysidine synthase
MHDLANRLLRTIRKHEFLRPGERVAVAVSGGADSVALLYLLEEIRAELGIVLSVAHVNHKLRGAESDEDEHFVAELTAAHGLELHSVSAPIESRGARPDSLQNIPAKSGVEAAARKLRYEFFRELARQGRATKIATAHTLDDQAETVLLRIFRGTGIRGLAGVHPRILLSEDDRVVGEVVRPLLDFRRAELRGYLLERRQAWREDSSNQDPAFLRNSLRQKLLPLITEEFGDAAIEHLAELAEIARAEEEWAISTQYLVPSTQSAAGERFPAAQVADKFSGVAWTGATLDVEQLLALPLAASRRLVRSWIEDNAPEAAVSFRLIEQLLELARSPAGKRVNLPQGSAAEGSRLNHTCGKTVRRGRQELLLESEANGAVGDYRYELAVPGAVAVPELGMWIEAKIVEVESVPETERQQLLDPESIGTSLAIRNWRAGDRYWPSHTKAEKKVKELLSDRHATGTGKKTWPVIQEMDHGSLIWMRGFQVPEAFRPRATRAIRIREIPLE